MLFLQQGRQPCGQRIHIGDQQQHHNADEQQGHQRLQRFGKARLADLIAQQQAQTHRRRHQTDAEVEATAGVYTVKVPNSSGIQLPITGGTGTVIFTIIGIALMVGAVVLFVISRKKAKAEENE